MRPIESSASTAFRYDIGVADDNSECQHPMCITLLSELFKDIKPFKVVV